MASLREIRRRIKSTQNTKQIMRAMQLVSASKFKRAQVQLTQGREMLAFLDGLLQRVLAATETVEHPLCVSHGGTSALLVVTSDTGLCGAYNTNLIQLAQATLQRASARPDHVIYLGKRGYSVLTKRGFPAAQAIVDMAGRPNLTRIQALGEGLLQRFLAGELASVHILSARFVSAAVSRPQVVPWLPAALGPSTQQGQPAQPTVAEEYVFEPSAEAVFNDLLPRWALAKFQLSILEAFTAEHGARMVAMKNATDNADELIQALTHQRNQIRQTAITKEISEIVGTAEALN
jgi:F-type H+-transporting ATPase subunit gamma